MEFTLNEEETLIRDMAQGFAESELMPRATKHDRQSFVDPEVFAKMKELVLEGVRAGAIGFATSTSPNHNGHGGIPMPSRLADDAELRELVGCLKEAGRGVFMLTKGGQTKIEFLEELAAACGRPVVVAALLHNNSSPRGVFDDLKDQRREGAAAGCWAPFLLRADHGFTLPRPKLEGLAAWKTALSITAKKKIMVEAKKHFATRSRRGRSTAPPRRSQRAVHGQGTRCTWERRPYETEWQQTTVPAGARHGPIRGRDARLRSRRTWTGVQRAAAQLDEQCRRMLRHPHSRYRSRAGAP